jgi:hypothetical protein
LVQDAVQLLHRRYDDDLTVAVVFLTRGLANVPWKSELRGSFWYVTNNHGDIPLNFVENKFHGI